MQVIVYGPAIIASVAGFMSIMITNLFGIDAKWRIPVALITIIAISLMNFLENNAAIIVLKSKTTHIFHPYL